MPSPEPPSCADPILGERCFPVGGEGRTDKHFAWLPPMFLGIPVYTPDLGVCILISLSGNPNHPAANQFLASVGWPDSKLSHSWKMATKSIIWAYTPWGDAQAGHSGLDEYEA